MERDALKWRPTAPLRLYTLSILTTTAAAAATQTTTEATPLPPHRLSFLIRREAQLSKQGISC